MTTAAIIWDTPPEVLERLVRADYDAEREATVYRLSPAGVLVKRDARREAGWMNPHFVVVDVPAGVVHHHVGERLTDAAVADWSPLVRARLAAARWGCADCPDKTKCAVEGCPR